MSGLILPYKGIMPRIHASAWVAPNACIAGDVEIGEDSSIWFGVQMRGDVHVIRIGSRTNIQDGTIIHVTRGVSGTHIGDGVTIGHKALLHACTIEDNAFVGMGVIVLDEAVVESGAMLAAGAVLTPKKRVPKGELWAGNPARKMRDLTQADIDFFPVSADNYVRLAKEYK
ncbi:MAG: gamma carbonic anhydrase family protein [Micavibrio aeruginosavorus]|uniref:Gamma carbonic anhydrase family protein n=1 Tax=Micavibrio aeruginosavorus TaxID=349221 RepID=A0A2W5A2N2_9BACT|nr:MAG: gamma carbonic anhydrase family protein [Micavibrio aeruginosavorus]